MILIIHVMFSHSNNEIEWKLCSEMTQHITYSLICGQVYLRVCSSRVIWDFDKGEIIDVSLIVVQITIQASAEDHINPERVS